MGDDDAGVLPRSRIDAFSDGVFAIAITLLVLELGVPEGSQDGDSLLADLARQWPSYLGYLVSFAFIGSVWVAHSRISKFLRAADQVFVGLNLVLLLLVSLLPFTTKLMATHLNDSGERVAVVVFGLNLLLAAVLVNALLNHAVRTPGLLDPGAGADLTSFKRQRRVSLIVQAAATAMGLLLPALAVVAYLAISLLVLTEPIVRAARGRRQPRQARGDAGVE